MDEHEQLTVLGDLAIVNLLIDDDFSLMAYNNSKTLKKGLQTQP